jgi:hypothetical protein
VQYEHLVADPAAVLGRIVAFLELDVAGLDAMLHHHETADIHSETLYSLASKPVTTEAVRTWERALRPREVAFVESVLGEWMRRYGYEPVAPAVKIPPELRRRYRRRRGETRLESARLRARELGLRVRYRAPVSARP